MKRFASSIDVYWYAATRLPARKSVSCAGEGLRVWPMLPFDVHRLRDDGHQLDRRVGSHFGERPAPPTAHLEQQLVHVGRLEGPREGEQFVQHHAEAEDVTARVDAVDLPTRLLGAHVQRRADDGALAVPRGDPSEPSHRLQRLHLGDWHRLHHWFRVCQHARDAPVEQHRLAELAHHHVLGLQVAVHDAAAVRVGDRVAEVDEVRQQLEARVERGGFFEGRSQRAAAHELLGAVQLALRGAAKLVHGDDARVFELSRDARLTHEAIGRVVRVACRLERDVTVQRGVFCGEDDCLTARAQLAFDDVAVGAGDRQRSGVSPSDERRWFGVMVAPVPSPSRSLTA
jgi:hypothetical protein